MNAEALRLVFDNVEALNNLGIAMHTLMPCREAQNDFRAVLRLAPEHANALLNLGVTRQSLGHLQEADDLYRRARTLGVDEARVCNNMALALAELDRVGRRNPSAVTCWRPARTTRRPRSISR